MALPRGARSEMIVYFIMWHSKERGFPPSVREIGSAVGLRTPAAVHSQLEKLAADGLVIWEKGKARTVRVVDEEVRRRWQEEEERAEGEGP